MLEKLFGSNLRVKILKIFLSSPDKGFFAKQLAKDFGLQLLLVIKELENLEKFGLLTSGEKNDERRTIDIGEELYPENMLVQEMQRENLKKEKEAKERKEKEESVKIKKVEKSFRINRQFILFEELKALIMKAQVLYEEDFINSLKKTGSIKLLVMSGFFVGNKAAKVDLLLVGKVNKPKVEKLVEDLEKELDREINYTCMEEREFKYRREVTDVFLYEVLESKKFVVINELGV
ncbi:hypothetical protein L6270_04910 [Candidatus Parcubacteria bacterium]|nr:hypothetical protein [Patescibacteria group bacterium]MBU4309301.1 hypothetical protein [Patescibacteria group bacterium]MBU4432278.1 hypothetical protein [Patescibacteria group bacterium]MBU4577662.1 hypothetical protein [Patescibacteria group bacterium]MCG2697348.1 hypothetical protein [Candidatus Parcubacteria bacterium]